ncbi:MAG: YlmH/Sll1252 family protein [Oscillospiraceae bacterium]|nr:YlmH/Sll1252 family protein [Oscillospiraceae bacterium]
MNLHDLEKRKGIGKFLTPAQAAEALRIFGPRVTLEGGFRDAERVIPVFAEKYGPEEHLAAIRLAFRPQDVLSHRDILGAALGLGLERDVLGDIFVSEGQAFLVCLARIAGYIIENLQQAGKVGLWAERIPLASLPEATKTLREQRGTVSSLRLDAVISEAFHCSRRIAEELITQGLVQLRHEACLKGDAKVREGDIISVRGKGRVKVLQAGEASRKGRVWVTVGHYV